MANLKEIKRKIKSVENTKKTTRAMKLVSTAKLRRAEMAAKKSRVYAQKINEVLSEIAYKINQYKIGGIDSRYFDLEKNIQKVDIIFVTADKGLCGGFNIQTIKQVQRLIHEYSEKNIEVRLIAVGRKGIDFFRFQGVNLLQNYIGISSSPTYEKAQDIITKAIEDFESGLTDKVILVHNGYKNMISQELKVVDVVPIAEPIISTQEEESKSMMELEPEEDETILNSLIKKYFEYNMYYALIDSLAAEHSARMQAMDNATNNAAERVHKLTLAYNKARQESITTELIEIISGVESMK
ncbi:MAG: ATP synthase F1 subunit gamma [Sulfurospirillaceae bacterium]|nr:ATP synthase F1 subunit gamma [Sulfurospirillaceae bacterium]